jgi:hypothetical protein
MVFYKPETCVSFARIMIRHTHTYIHIYMHTHTTFGGCHVWSWCLIQPVHSNMHAHAHTHTHTQTYMSHACLDTKNAVGDDDERRVQTYTHMHACMHTRTYTHKILEPKYCGRAQKNRARVRRKQKYVKSLSVYTDL